MVLLSGLFLMERVSWPGLPISRPGRFYLPHVLWEVHRHFPTVSIMSCAIWMSRFRSLAWGRMTMPVSENSLPASRRQSNLSSAATCGIFPVRLCLRISGCWWRWFTHCLPTPHCRPMSLRQVRIWCVLCYTIRRPIRNTSSLSSSMSICMLRLAVIWQTWLW